MTATLLSLSMLLLNFLSKLHHKPFWRAQLNALVVGYDLLGHIDGTLPSPPTTSEKDGKSIPNPAYTRWYRQDKLLLHAIIASTLETVMPLIASATTAKEA